MFPLSPTHVDAIQAVAGIVTIISFPLIFLSLFIAYQQVRSQTRISRKELSFNGLMTFSTNYQKISVYRNHLAERFDSGDRTVNRRSVFSYFAQYWLHCSQQWDFFLFGLIPADTFIAWTVFAYSVMGEHTIFEYYDKDGSVAVMTGQAYFENHFMKGAYRHNKLFFEFYKGLYDLRLQRADGGQTASDARYEAISHYVRAYMKKHRIKL